MGVRLLRLPPELHLVGVVTISELVSLVSWARRHLFSLEDDPDSTVQLALTHRELALMSMSLCNMLATAIHNGDQELYSAVEAFAFKCDEILGVQWGSDEAD